MDPTDSQLTEERTPEPRVLLWVAVAFAAGALVLTAYGAYVATHGINWWQKMGDALAPAAALLSASALGAAVLSVILQSKELRLQREELRASRRAQQALAAAQELSNSLTSSQIQHQHNANLIAVIANRLNTEQARVSTFQLMHDAFESRFEVFLSQKVRGEPLQLEGRDLALFNRLYGQLVTLKDVEAALQAVVISPEVDSPGKHT